MYNNPMETIRIQRYLSEQGIASRREAASWITAGYISLNGKKVTDTGARMMPGKDTLTIDPKIKEKKKYYFLFNKPMGIVTVGAQKDEKAIKDIIKLPEGVVPVGRLDKDTGGLIFLTNDGVVARRIMDPTFYHEKEYEVTLSKAIPDVALQRLSEGVMLFGEKTRPAKIQRIGGYRFLLTITEGKNRQVRRMCEIVGYPVKYLLRKRILHFNLGAMKPGILKELSTKEVSRLYTELDLNR